MRNCRTLLNKYSSSQELRLTVRQSQRRRLALLALGVAIALALVQLAMLDYVVLALLVMLVSAVILYLEWSDTMAGVVVIWREGQWFVARGTQEICATLDATTVNLPQLVFLSLRSAQVRTRWRILLFCDSAEEDQLRQLRCRLTLSCGHKT
jgi:hypothetical protein